MSDLYFLPIIARQDYDSFRTLDGFDLSDTYDEWLNLTAKEKLERGRVGFVVKEIKVDPHEFGRFCRAYGTTANGARLLFFAEEKAAGKQY